MLVFAARDLGLYTIVLDPTPDSPAGQVADIQIVGDFKDAEKIYEVSKLSDVVTFEIESANGDALQELVLSGHEIHPSPKTLSIIKDKYLQKRFLEENKIPVAAYISVENVGEIQEVVKKFGYPFLLKARRDAYDGRENALVHNEPEIILAIEKLKERTLYVEKFVAFTKELAVVVARSKSGEVVPYPVVETVHKNNICHMVLSPAPISSSTAKKAEDLAIQIMSYLEGVGVFCIEMFLTSENEVIVNEVAPRVHNSGHHSIEAHGTSQFEQHIRAITGMPLGSIERTAPVSVMINILGERSGRAKVVGLEKAEKVPGVSVHMYGKVETRPERKMGHITVVGDRMEVVLGRAKMARRLITI